jgi:hypothetical protein
MDLFIVIEEKINIPIAIFDDFNKAKQYMHCMPSKHLYIYQYRLNELNTEKKISDSYFIHGI